MRGHQKKSLPHLFTSALCLILQSRGLLSSSFYYGIPRFPTLFGELHWGAPCLIPGRQQWPESLLRKKRFLFVSSARWEDLMQSWPLPRALSCQERGSDHRVRVSEEATPLSVFPTGSFWRLQGTQWAWIWLIFHLVVGGVLEVAPLSSRPIPVSRCGVKLYRTLIEMGQAIEELGFNSTLHLCGK